MYEWFHFSVLCVSSCIHIILSLSRAVVPLIQGFEDAGDFTMTDRLKTSIHVNLVFYSIVGSLGLLGLILLITMHRNWSVYSLFLVCTVLFLRMMFTSFMWLYFQLSCDHTVLGFLFSFVRLTLFTLLPIQFTNDVQLFGFMACSCGSIILSGAVDIFGRAFLIKQLGKMRVGELL